MQTVQDHGLLRYVVCVSSRDCDPPCMVRSEVIDRGVEYGMCVWARALVPRAVIVFPPWRSPRVRQVCVACAGGDTLLFISAIQSIDRLYLWQYGNVVKIGIRSWKHMQQLQLRVLVCHWDICIFLGLFFGGELRFDQTPFCVSRLKG